MEDYRQKFGANALAKAKDAEIGAKIADAGKKRSATAMRGAATASAGQEGDHRRQFRGAAEIMQRLTGDLAETDYVKSNLTR